MSHLFRPVCVAALAAVVCVTLLPAPVFAQNIFQRMFGLGGCPPCPPTYGNQPYPGMVQSNRYQVPQYNTPVYRAPVSSPTAPGCVNGSCTIPGLQPWQSNWNLPSIPVNPAQPQVPQWNLTNPSRGDTSPVSQPYFVPTGTSTDRTRQPSAPIQTHPLTPLWNAPAGSVPYGAGGPQPAVTLY